MMRYGLSLLLILSSSWVAAEVVQPDDGADKPKPVTVEPKPAPTPVVPALVPKPASSIVPDVAPATPATNTPKTLTVDEPGFKATVKFVDPSPPKVQTVPPPPKFEAPKKYLRANIWSAPQEIDAQGNLIAPPPAPEATNAPTQVQETISPALAALMAKEKSNKKSKEMLALYQDLLKDEQEKKSPEAWYRLGLLHLKEGNTVDAMASMGEALALSPANAKYQCDFGIACLRAGQADKALVACQSAAVTGPSVARYQSALGDCFLTMGRGVEAADAYQRAITLEPTNPNYVYNMGLAQMNQKQFKKALDVFDEAIRINPNNPQYYCSRGIVLENMKKIREATGCYLRALAIDKNFARAHYLLASVYSDPNDPTFTSAAEAVEHAQKAVKLTEWKNAEYLMGLARALRVAHNFDEAVMIAKKAVQLEPRPEFRKEMDGFEKLRTEGNFELTK